MSSQVSSARPAWRARQGETLRRLLEAGRAEVASRGHDELTVRTVAARAGVSPATAYSYLGSKQHLFAELFLGYLLEEDPGADLPVADVATRVRTVTRRIADRLVEAPELAAAVTPALLSNDPDVERLRLQIGAVFARCMTEALRGPGDHGRVDPVVLDALLLAFSGALLQAGMGLSTYDQMGDRLDDAVAVILRGNP